VVMVLPIAAFAALIATLQRLRRFPRPLGPHARPADRPKPLRARHTCHMLLQSPALR
jgi:hypothetical protein